MTSPQTNDNKPLCILHANSNGACAGEVKAHEDVEYCSLHHPADDRLAEFLDAYKQKFEKRDFNFAWVRFPLPIVLTDQQFDGDVDLSFANFTSKFVVRAVTFQQGVKCVSATFNDKVAISAHFLGLADFTFSEFHKGANFLNSIFTGPTMFGGVNFGAEARFNLVRFENDAEFSARFQDAVQFSGNDRQIVFSLAKRAAFDSIRLDHPELAMITNTPLRPWWFINAPSSKIVLVDVKWQNNVRDEVAKATEAYGARGYGLLATAYRNLAVNSEEMHRYREASDFRYSSMEAQRLAKNGGYAFWTLHWWYWAASGYGERIGRAVLFLLALWFIFGLVYMRVGFTRTDLPAPAVQQSVVAPDEYGKPLRPGKALMYSLGVLSLQKPDPKPLTDTAEFAVILESVFGPLQAALLILAIRRKFMR